MLDFLTSEYFIGLVLGFALLYMFQVLYKGPQEADRDLRVEDYMERLGEEKTQHIEALLKAKKKDEAAAYIQEEASVGTLEAKEVITFVTKTMKNKS